MTSDKSHLLLPFSLGFTAMSAQIILLREFLVLFNGNELVIGLILADWMLLTSLGAWLGKFAHGFLKDLPGILNLLFGLSVLIPVILFLSDLSRNILFPAGSMAGVLQVFYTTCILLLPFCVISGFLFTRISAYVSAKFNQNGTAKVYSIESLGSIAGGILVNFILVFTLLPFQSLLLILLLNAGIIVSIARKGGFRKTFIIISTITIILAGFLLIGQPDVLSRKFLFPGQDLLYYKDTPYGNLTVTSNSGQKNFYLNNSLLFSTNTVIDNEEAVHYAMLQCSSPKKVLMLEGGISGSIREVLKYPVGRIDYVEINPWIIRLGERYAPEMLNPEVHIAKEDARIFLQRTNQRFDAVLFQVQEPSTLQANRYYTLEFFQLLKSRLQPGAVISVSLMPTPNYVGAEALRVQACLWTTLKKVFRHLAVIPGEKNYFLASDKAIRTDIAALVSEKQIPVEYVNEYYLDDALLQQRSREIMETIDRMVPVNRDFEPRLFYGEISYWLSYFGHSNRILPVLLLLLLAAWFTVNSGINAGLFATGFTASALELILLFVFQVIYGYIYLMAGIIFTVFMAGLALGAAYGKKIVQIPTYRGLTRLQFMIAVYCVLVVCTCLVLKNYPMYAVTGHSLIMLMILGISVLAGVQFGMAARVKQGAIESISGSMYSADLLGAAAGALLAGTWLVAVLGITGSIWVIAGLNGVTSLWMIMKRK